MEKVVDNDLTDLSFTQLQEETFNQFSKEEQLTQKFYFTGGTALSAVYLHHRESEDLDFFSESDFENVLIEQFIQKVAQKNKLRVRFTQIEKTRIFELLDSSGKEVIKIDFNFYPYKRLELGRIIKNVAIDSLKDIATNKLQTIISRTEIKDFVDLYFLLQKYTIWDLIYAIKVKFSKEIDLILLSGDLLKIEQFDYLPKMLIPLELTDLKTYFKEKAKQIGMKIVE